MAGKAWSSEGALHLVGSRTRQGSSWAHGGDSGKHSALQACPRPVLLILAAGSTALAESQVPNIWLCLSRKPGQAAAGAAGLEADSGLRSREVGLCVLVESLPWSCPRGWQKTPTLLFPREPPLAAPGAPHIPEGQGADPRLQGKAASQPGWLTHAVRWWLSFILQADSRRG